MAIDIIKAIQENDIKNGTVIVSCTKTGEYSLNNDYVKNTPTISDIENKYDNRFGNGLLVELVGTSGVIGV